MTRRAVRPGRSKPTARFLVILTAVSALVVGLFVPAGAAAASAGPTAGTGVVKTYLTGFTPGNIISDAVFTNRSTMTEAQIQTFLNGKVPVCRSGYVCLKDLRVTTQTKAADSYCAGYSGQANESAARIIFKVSQSCRINPQVLIVMLQKEQGLVTHTWPSPWRYNAAMGQACPDDAPCDTAYAGFFAQVYGAARQMQIYLEGRWFTWYAPGKTWNILYNPNRTCGSAPVYIANKATSALYYYTPYQPNAAALRAGYGVGDACSAYGNRNFYNYFTDWFGSTQNPPKPEQPAVTPPVLRSADTDAYVVATDANGVAWGYPFTKGVWGARVQLASGLGKVLRISGLGDLNGDGHRDFLILDASRRVLAIYGTGSLQFTAPKAVAGTWSGLVDAIPAGDFTGDGIPDLFTTDTSGRLWLRSGDDRGGFRAPVQIGQGWSSMSLLTGGVDMNGDGAPDLVARDAGGALHLFQGNGRGGWGPTTRIGNGWTSMTSLFSPGDFTGNGTADLLAHGADGTLHGYDGRGAAYPVGVGVVGMGWNAMTAKGSAGPAVTKGRPFRPGFADADAAGNNDVVALTSGGELRIYGGNGRGGWAGTRTAATGWAATDRVIPLGDFTGDGRHDLGRIDASGALLLYPGVAGGGYGKAVRIGQGWSALPIVVGGIDFDGDRRTDVLAVDKAGVLRLYRGNGSGGWAETGRQIGQGWSSADLVVNAGDFTGDGHVDLIARMKDGTLRVYPTANGRFGTVAQIGHGWSGMTSIAGPGDFDGDGQVDLVAVRSDGSMHLYSGNGRGGWKSAKQIGTGWQSIVQIG